MGAKTARSKKATAKKAPAKGRSRRTRPAPAVAIPSPDEVLGPIGASLNDQQRAFAHRYAIDGNGTLSYLEVYGVADDNTAAVNARRLLQKPEVAELVASLRQATLDKYKVTAERIVQEYARIAFLDLGELYDDEGKLLPVKKIPEDARRAVAGIECDEIEENLGGGIKIVVGYTKKVKLSDKRAALFDLAKIHGMITDKQQHSVSESLEALLSRSWAPEGGAHA